MNIRFNRTVIMAGIAFVIILILMMSSGGVVDFLSYDCRVAAESMGLNWSWTMQNGCFLQQPDGTWIPLDAWRVR